MGVPKVTVCIPVRNRERFIEAAMVSVLSQTFRDFELIVYDNASTDGTCQVARSFDDPRVSVVTSDTVLEMTTNWNRCLRGARGEYVCVFHSDDIMDTENLAAKVAFLDSHPGVGMVHSNVHLIDERGVVIATGWQNQPAATGIEEGFIALKRMVFLNPVCASSVVLRRSILREVGLFNESFRFAPDWDLWLRIAARAPVGYIREPLVSYRLHPSQVSEEITNSGQALSEERRVIDGFLQQESHVNTALRVVASRGQAVRALLQCRRRAGVGDMAGVIQLLTYALRVYPCLSLQPKVLGEILLDPSLSSLGDRLRQWAS